MYNIKINHLCEGIAIKVSVTQVASFSSSNSRKRIGKAQMQLDTLQIPARLYKSSESLHFVLFFVGGAQNNSFGNEKKKLIQFLQLPTFAIR